MAYTFTLAAAAFTSCCDKSAVRSSCSEGSTGVGMQQGASTIWSGLVVVHCRRTATGLILHFGIGVEVRTAVYDLDVFEAGREQPVLVVIDLDCAGDAADVGSHALRDGFGKFMFEGYVADRDPSSWLEDAGNLTEHGGLVGREV